MKTDMFTHELRNTSSVFGRTSNIRVEFRGTEAMTDGKVIILPALPGSVEVSPTAESVMRGYVDHEAGHNRHSDMSAITSIYRQWHKKGRNFAKAMHNALEDMWMEAKVRDEYAGSEANLTATAEAVNAEFLRCVDLPESEEGHIPRAILRDPKQAAPLAVTLLGRTDYAGPATRECIELLRRENPDLFAKAEAWVSEVRNKSTTRHAIKMAERIEKELHVEPDDPDDEGDVDGGGDSDESHGDSKRRRDASTPTSGVKPESGEDKGRVDPLTTEAPKFDPSDLSKALKDTLGHEHLTPKDLRAPYLAYSTELDGFHHRTTNSNMGKRLAAYAAQGGGNYNAKVNDMSSVVSTMRRRLERALLSKQNRDWDVGREQGRIDPKRLVSAVAGRSNVFRERAPRAEMDTAVSIVVDLSGSMSGRVYLANQCVLALVESIARTGAAYEVVGFHNSEAPREWSAAVRVADRDHGIRYTRWEPLEMPIFKSFEETLASARGTLAAITNFVGRENSDGEAVAAIGARLLARREQRHILLVLSDGQPSCLTRSQEALKVHLRETVNELERKGVVCVGIGMQSYAVRSYYPRHVVVKDMEDLAGEALTILSKALLGERITLLPEVA
jgi:cobalamin biosynthesis protein CobT